MIYFLYIHEYVVSVSVIKHILSQVITQNLCVNITSTIWIVGIHVTMATSLCLMYYTLFIWRKIIVSRKLRMCNDASMECNYIFFV